MKKDVDEKGNFLAVYCKKDNCFSAVGVGSSHEMILMNQAMRLGIQIKKNELENENYFKDLKKTILKNKKKCACEKKEISEL